MAPASTSRSRGVTASSWICEVTEHEFWSNHRHRHRGRRRARAPCCSSPPPARPMCAAPARSSRETRKRDKAASAARSASTTGAEVERPPPIQRSAPPWPSRPDCRPCRGSHPTPRSSASTAVSSSTAPSSRMMSVVARHVRAGLHRLPLPQAGWWLRLEGQRRQARRHHPGHPRRQRLLLPPRGPHLGHRVPAPTPSPRPRRSTPVPVLDRHEGRHRRPLPEVPPPRLPRARVRQLAVVRVPVPRLAVQPGR